MVGAETACHEIHAGVGEGEARGRGLLADDVRAGRALGAGGRDLDHLEACIHRLYGLAEGRQRQGDMPGPAADVEGVSRPQGLGGCLEYGKVRTVGVDRALFITSGDRIELTGDVLFMIHVGVSSWVDFKEHTPVVYGYHMGPLYWYKDQLVQEPVDSGMMTRKKELGRFLRALRERSPAPAGARRRRTPGLRREELAAQCGISATWYTWIEQGRAEGVSPDTLARLAEALVVTDAERRYLWEVAGLGPQRLPRPVPQAPAEMASVLAHIDAPAYCLGRYWDALAWNAGAQELFPDWLGERACERNLLDFVFSVPAARDFIVDWPARARRLVAEFAADAADLAGDPHYEGMVGDLSARSPDFRDYWQRREVSFRDPTLKAFRHPVRGLVLYEQTTFAPLVMRDLKLVILCARPNV